MKVFCIELFANCLPFDPIFHITNSTYSGADKCHPSGINSGYKSLNKTCLGTE